MQPGIDLVDGRRAYAGCAATGNHQRHSKTREASWIVDDELLLGNSVQPFRLQKLLGLEAVVENSETAAQDHFRRRIPAANSPRNSQARRPVAMIVDVVLRLKAQASAESDVWANPPVILQRKARRRRS